ncbi:MAG: hypothetical protein II669_00925, partial [Elusimicrobia bacterium]|nr:hypothetical protein [Elusimicrobiota bacterium]
AVFYSRINRYVLALKEIDIVREQYEQKRRDILQDKDLNKSSKRRFLEDLDRETASKVRAIKTSLNTLNKVNLKSWRSLPEEINMATVSLPKGKYTIIIKYLDKKNNVIKTQEIKTKIRKQRNRFVLTNSFKGF